MLFIELTEFAFLPLEVEEAAGALTDLVPEWFVGSNDALRKALLGAAQHSPCMRAMTAYAYSNAEERPAEPISMGDPQLGDGTRLYSTDPLHFHPALLAGDPKGIAVRSEHA